MAETARDLITNVLLDLGVIADEETPTASQAAGALRKLNNMIDSWNIQNLLVYGGIQNVFPLVANQQVYTIGTGGNFNIPRPNSITTAYIRENSTGYDFPMEMINQEDYANIQIKNLTTSLPQAVFFDYDFPYTSAYLWPIPSTTQYSLVFWSNGIISNFTLDGVISLAPGYKRALEANLCIELAATYGVQLAPSIVKIAQDSKADLMTQNFDLNELAMDPRLVDPRYFNYITGNVQ